MKSNEAYLRHILDAINNIEEYIGSADLDTFVKDNKTVSAVVKELENMGEAANRLSEDFKQQHPQIPYRNMIDMRNVLIHEYFGVIRKTVWDTVYEDLPSLKRTILGILDKE